MTAFISGYLNTNYYSSISKLMFTFHPFETLYHFHEQRVVGVVCRVLFKMPTNIEIKAYLKNRKDAIEVAKKLSQSQGIIHCLLRVSLYYYEFLGSILKQQDTFYNVPTGRLKVEIIESVILMYVTRMVEPYPKPQVTSLYSASSHSSNLTVPLH